MFSLFGLKSSHRLGHHQNLYSDPPIRSTHNKLHRQWPLSLLREQELRKSDNPAEGIEHTKHLKNTIRYSLQYNIACNKAFLILTIPFVVTSQGFLLILDLKFHAKQVQTSGVRYECLT